MNLSDIRDLLRDNPKVDPFYEKVEGDETLCVMRPGGEQSDALLIVAELAPPRSDLSAAAETIASTGRAPYPGWEVAWIVRGHVYAPHGSEVHRTRGDGGHQVNLAGVLHCAYRGCPYTVFYDAL